MSNNAPSIRALQAIGITTTAFLSGGMTIISVMAMPALLSSPTIQPSTALKQWTSMYALGKVTTPPSLTVTSLLFLYLSYRHLSSSLWYKPKGRLFLLAGGIVAGVLAFTYGVLETTNHEMLRLASVSKEQDEEFMVDREERIRELLERWRLLNLARGVALAVATAVGTYAVFRRGKWVAKAEAAGRGWRRWGRH